MKGWRTLFLLLAVLGLAGYIYFHERFQADTPTRLEERRRAFAMDVEQVKLLGIRTAAYDIELARGVEDWSLTGVEGSRVQDAMVRQLLSRLRALTRGELITPSDMRDRGQTLADFGLAVPTAVLRIQDLTGLREYRIGNPNPLATSIYVKEEGSQNVMMISTDLLEILPEDADDLRDRRLVHFPPAHLREVYVSHSTAGRMRLARETGAWRFLDPADKPADSEEVDEWLQKLILARIETFLPPDAGAPSDFGFDSPVAELRFRGTSAAESVELQLGAPVQDQPGLRYGRFVGHPWVFTVSEGVNVLAATPSAQLRDPRLITVSASELQRMELHPAGESPLVFVREDGGWLMRRPYERPASGALLDRVLEVWLSARIAAYGPPPEDEAPLYRMRLLTPGVANGTQVLDVNVFPPEIEGVSRVQQVGREEMFYVLPEALSALPLDPVAYLSPLIFEVDPEKIIRVTLRHGEHARTYSRADSPDWQVDDDQGEAESLSALIDRVALLRADTLISMGPPAGMATLLARTPVRVSFGLRDDPRASLTLLLWRDPESGEHLAKVQGRELHFQLDAETVEALLRPMPPSTDESDDEAESEPDAPS